MARRGWTWVGIAAAAFFGACASDTGPTAGAWDALTRYVLDEGNAEDGPKPAVRAHAARQQRDALAIARQDDVCVASSDAGTTSFELWLRWAEITQ